MKLPKISAKIIKLGAALSLLGIGIYAVMWPLSTIHFSIGILIGIILSVLRIFLLSKTVEKNLADVEDAKAAKAKIQFNHTLRYIITLVVLLLVAFNLHYISILGTAFSVTAFQVAIYLSNIEFKKR